MKYLLILVFFIFLFSLNVFASADILYKNVKPIFIQKAYLRFDQFYFATCPHYKFKSDSVENNWIKQQQLHYKVLGHPLDKKNKFIAPQYAWVALKDSTNCYSITIPRLTNTDTKNLVQLLKKYGFTKTTPDDVYAIEFLFKPQKINLYLKDKKTALVLKASQENLNLNLKSTSVSSTIADIKQAVNTSIDPKHLKKIGPFISSVFTFEENNKANPSVFFLSNMFPGFLTPSGDRLVQDVLREFHFKPRAISPLTAKEFIVYYP